MDLMRRAADAGLVEDASAWYAYRELRNRTSRTYDRHEAQMILKEAPAFLQSASRVLEGLQARNG